MNTEDFKTTVPDASLVGPAVLPQFRVDFTYSSFQRDGGVADLVEDFADETYGILWEIPTWVELDKREGVPYVYERVPVTVIAGGSSVEAQTYRVIHKESPRAPSTEYLSLILAPASSLPREYLEELQERALKLPREPKVSPNWLVEINEVNGGETRLTFFNPYEGAAVVRNARVLGLQAELKHQPSDTRVSVL